MRNLNPNSIIVTVNNKYPIDVKCIQSFNINQQLSEKAMDAFLELCVLRDAQLVTAYNEVNHDKAGFVPRLGCMYLLSTFAILLMQPDVSVEQFLNYDLVQGLIRKQAYQISYRSVIPLFWKGDPNEWFLIIVDSSNHSVNFIFTKYSAVIDSQICDDAKAALCVDLKEKLSGLLSAQPTPPTPTPTPPTTTIITTDADEGQQLIDHHQQPTIIIQWTFINHFSSTGTDDLHTDPHRRIPLSHYHCVSEKTALGIYIMYSIECDYFDTPIFAPLETDWLNIRRNLAYCIINEQLMLS